MQNIMYSSPCYISPRIYRIGLSTLLLISSPCLFAQTLDMDALFNMDIAELLNVDVSLSSRKEERQFTLAAASYVITQEDIQRSGHRSIPELLRLVPGFHVGKIDANKWGINSRSSTNQFTGSMLVMMDGRTLYNPLFAGTRWGEQDYFIEDIERIEVIRGPGGASWGANAVNGIVNIVTKSAKDTQGTYFYAGVGTGEVHADTGIRFGVKPSEDSYLRFYEKNRLTDNGEYLDNNESNNDGFFKVGDDAYDNGRLEQTGFRLDWDISPKNSLTIQGDTYSGKLRDIRTVSSTVAANDIEISGSNILTRWAHKVSSTSSFTLQSYLDLSQRSDDSFVDEYTIADIDFQHNIQLNNHAISWALGLRKTSDDTSNPATFTLNPSSRTDRLYSAFIQDKWEIISDELWLTMGLKEENNDYTGNEYQPSLKLAWAVNNHNTLWGSLSRVVRTPSRGDSDAILDFGAGGTVVIGDPELESKIVHVAELGHRGVISARTMVETALFYTRIRDHFLDPAALRDDHSYGIEINTHHEINDCWNIEFWVATHLLYSLDPATNETSQNKRIQNPTAHLRSYWDITPNWQFDTLIYFSGNETVSSGTEITKPLHRIDFHIGWKPKDGISLDITLSNMQDDTHDEARESTRINTGVNRGFYSKLSLAF